MRTPRPLKIVQPEFKFVSTSYCLPPIYDDERAVIALHDMELATVRDTDRVIAWLLKAREWLKEQK